MSDFEYDAPAELFLNRKHPRSKGCVTYRRFAVAADAIRFAVEGLPPKLFITTYLEVNEQRFDFRGIRHLYESAEYPLFREPPDPASVLPSAEKAKQQ